MLLCIPPLQCFYNSPVLFLILLSSKTITDRSINTAMINFMSCCFLLFANLVLLSFSFYIIQHGAGHLNQQHCDVNKKCWFHVPSFFCQTKSPAFRAGLFHENTLLRYTCCHPGQYLFSIQFLLSFTQLHIPRPVTALHTGTIESSDKNGLLLCCKFISSYCPVFKFLIGYTQTKTPAFLTGACY
jgi:hypothetical protein